jgi:glutamine amidotransferase
MICIIDYGSGNVAALMNIFKQQRIPHFLSGNPAEFKNASKFLLPGVGAFDPTMEQLTHSGIVEALGEQVVCLHKPVLGICVGMHLLSEGSEEGSRPGLGWIKGRVRKIDTSNLGKPPHLPHMGWNSISVQPNALLFDSINQSRGFYFLHSYYFDAERVSDVSAYVDYGKNLPCGVQNGNVFGMQFHPEKSHSNGVRLLRNFAELN